MTDRATTPIDKLSNALQIVASMGFLAAAAALLLFYLNFAVRLRQPLATDVAAWGQFGDYLGGVLNPVVALCALILLAVGVRIQNETLKTAKEEFQALKTLAAQDRFAAQFSAFVALLADLKTRGSYVAPVNVAAKTIAAWIKLAEPTVEEERRVRKAIARASTAIQPAMSLIRTIFDLVSSQALPGPERERYLEVVRNFLSPEECATVLMSVRLGRMPDSDRRLLDEGDLLKYMDPKMRRRTEDAAARLLTASA